MFAKLYDYKDSQILVKLDSNDKGIPEIKVYFEPENLGVCHQAIKYKDDTESEWVIAEKAFKDFTEEFAVKIVENNLKFMDGLVGNG